MRYLQRILYLTTQFFCIDPKHRTPRRMECPSEDVCREVVIFSRKVLKDRRMLPWMATGAVPVRIRTATHFSLENSHRETSHRGRTFRSPWAFVASSLTLNLHVFNLPVDGVYAMFFQEIIRLAERSAAKESTVRR